MAPKQSFFYRVCGRGSLAVIRKDVKQKKALLTILIKENG